MANGKLMSKNVSYACIPEGRTADHYAKKANVGHDLSELSQLETSFDRIIEQPQFCVTPQVCF